MQGFDWEQHRVELDRIFFKDFNLVPRGSQEHTEFWAFFRRYQQFQFRKPPQARPPEDKSRGFGKFDLPQTYDRSYRIPFSIVPPDLAYKLRLEQDRRSEKRRDGSLTLDHLHEVRTVLRHFILFKQKQKFEKLLKIRRDQSNLPIHSYKSSIVSAVFSHQVVIVAGDTGCGKSTQVPQFLLDAGVQKIACTQPRRIACISLAKRVGYETLNEFSSEIAYQVRFERSRTLATRIVFLTEGLLLRQLSTDSDLSQYDVVIVDEVHERHIHGDFLLGILKGLIEKRKTLKLVLMSATINIQLFSTYFEGAPVIRVPGRLYPIELEYHPVSSTQVLQGEGSSGRSRPERLNPKPYLRIMQGIDAKYPSDERGDLLIFLSGMNEISTLMEEAKTYATQTQHWIILPLHSALSIEEQDRVFDVAPDGVRKCIISTNIAETSVTIDGVRFVVDSGKVKEMSFDSQLKMRRLQEFWISRASAEQRKGRAGRTGPGVCFRMYAESDYDSFNEYSTPEILRVPLDSLVLQVKALDNGNVRKFPFLEPPALASIETAVAFLKEQGALTSDECLTPIGRMLSQLPVDVLIGKILIMGTVFHVIGPILVVAAALSVQSPFSRVLMGQSDISIARRPLESEQGDPFTLLNAYDEWIQMKAEGSGSVHRWCRRRGLEQQRFYEITKLKEQFQEILLEYGLLPRGYVESVPSDRGGRGLTEDQRRELRQMRKRQRAEHRKKKILRLDDEGGALSDNEEESVTSDLKDLEFKLLHDLSQLQEASNVRRNFTLKDINLLKIVLCSGLYPQLAIADDCNSNRKDSEQVYHTKMKSFVLLHPTSIFSTSPEYLHPEGTDKCKELLAYVDLLETNKPYLVNAVRVPALQTISLFSQSLDTNNDCTRLIADSWLELKFPSAEVGERVMGVVQTLRATWAELLDTKLTASQSVLEPCKACASVWEINS
ncbi:probable ATP-dependent RNA helicase DHX34 isoform X2 [Halichondria panicea]|uniref:probable ATP-dependent RNA helicase DHX34 isoform X2 n=1 Tax=Halichondria panicea TaxID=6063 RepID=UPI00312BB421